LLRKVVHAIVAQPAVYDAVQRLAGFETMSREIAPYLRRTSGGSVLDLGAGTGNLKNLLPADARYIWLDNDEDKLRGFRARHPDERAIFGSGAEICFGDKSVDHVVVIGVAHHLDDDAFATVLGEIARITRKGLIFLDPLKRDNAPVSDLLWRFDRGDHPRREPRLLEFLDAEFDVEQKSNYSVYHSYLLCYAVPKSR
jgi:ubiquinone/menaquinone biosynthesis C-methylase UbiE